MVSQVYRDRDGTLVDLVDYVAVVHRQARTARTREVGYQSRRAGDALRHILAAAARRVDAFLFPPQMPAR